MFHLNHCKFFLSISLLCFSLILSTPSLSRSLIAATWGRPRCNCYSRKCLGRLVLKPFICNLPIDYAFFCQQSKLFKPIRCTAGEKKNSERVASAVQQPNHRAHRLEHQIQWQTTQCCFLVYTHRQMKHRCLPWFLKTWKKGKIKKCVICNLGKKQKNK